MGPMGGFGVLRNRAFFRLWLAQLISSIGDWLAILALFSLASFRLQGTPLQVAAMMIAFVAPVAFIGPLAGVFADRWDVKRTMIGSDLIRAGLVALLALATRWHEIYLLVFALTTVTTFVRSLGGATGRAAPGA